MSHSRITELHYQSIQSHLEFITDAQAKTWRDECFSNERNKLEEKWRLESIQQSKDQIKFHQEQIKQLTK